MSRKDDCIRELYQLLDKIEKNAQRGNLTLVEKPHVACGGGDCPPPIEKMINSILDEYGDIIYMAFKEKEIEEWRKWKMEQEGR